jgi:integrase
VKAPRPAPEEMHTPSETVARTRSWTPLGGARHRFEPLYVLAITTGLRCGEFLGLRLDDADLDRGTLHCG